MTKSTSRLVTIDADTLKTKTLFINGTQITDNSQNTSDIATNASNISQNTSNIATNTSNISTNATNIAQNTSNIATNAGKISNLALDDATGETVGINNKPPDIDSQICSNDTFHKNILMTNTNYRDWAIGHFGDSSNPTNALGFTQYNANGSPEVYMTIDALGLSVNGEIFTNYNVSCEGLNLTAVNNNVSYTGNVIFKLNGSTQFQLASGSRMQ